jgi:hypothetical protein
VKTPVKDFVLPIIEEMIQEGEKLKTTKFTTGVIGAPPFVEVQGFGKFIGRLKSLAFILGELGQPWNDELTKDHGRNAYPTLVRLIGLLEAIKNDIENDHLIRAESMIRAEALSDLLEQAEYLLEQGYYLAAGVLARAVIEQHLRKRCDELGCMPSKSRPTINDFNQALYASKHIDKIAMKHIDSLAAVGNDSAHNNPSLKQEDVERLVREVPNILQKI